MAESKSPDQVVGCLEKNPDVAKWMGIFLEEFASAEFMFVKLFAIVLGEDDKMSVSHAILGRIRGIYDRAKIIADAAAASKLETKTKDLIITFTNEILEINALRNEYVHGLYETDINT